MRDVVVLLACVLVQSGTYERSRDIGPQIASTVLSWHWEAARPGSRASAPFADRMGYCSLPRVESTSEFPIDVHRVLLLV